MPRYCRTRSNAANRPADVRLRGHDGVRFSGCIPAGGPVAAVPPQGSAAGEDTQLSCLSKPAVVPLCMTVKVCRVSSELQAAVSRYSLTVIHCECSCGCTGENSHNLGPALLISLDITKLIYAHPAASGRGHGRHRRGGGRAAARGQRRAVNIRLGAVDAFVHAHQPAPSDVWRHRRPRRWPSAAPCRASYGTMQHVGRPWDTVRSMCEGGHLVRRWR